MAGAIAGVEAYTLCVPFNRSFGTTDIAMRLARFSLAVLTNRGERGRRESRGVEDRGGRRGICVLLNVLTGCGFSFFSVLIISYVSLKLFSMFISFLIWGRGVSASSSCAFSTSSSSPSSPSSSISSFSFTSSSLCACTRSRSLSCSLSSLLVPSFSFSFFPSSPAFPFPIASFSPSCSLSSSSCSRPSLCSRPSSSSAVSVSAAKRVKRHVKHNK